MYIRLFNHFNGQQEWKTKNGIKSEKEIEHNFKLWILLVTSCGWMDTVFILFRQAFIEAFVISKQQTNNQPTNISLIANLQCILLFKIIWFFIVQMNVSFWISFNRIWIKLCWNWYVRVVCAQVNDNLNTKFTYYRANW